MRIPEEFWYGNIEPTEYNTFSYKEYKKLRELICRNEEKLRATITDGRKSRLRSTWSVFVSIRLLRTACCSGAVLSWKQR